VAVAEDLAARIEPAADHAPRRRYAPAHEVPGRIRDPDL